MFYTWAVGLYLVLAQYFVCNQSVPGLLVCTDGVVAASEELPEPGLWAGGQLRWRRLLSCGTKLANKGQVLGQQETTRNIRPSKPLRVNKNLRSNLRAKERREVEAEADDGRRRGNPPSWKYHYLIFLRLEGRTLHPGNIIV